MTHSNRKGGSHPGDKDYNEREEKTRKEKIKTKKGDRTKCKTTVLCCVECKVITS